MARPSVSPHQPSPSLHRCTVKINSLMECYVVHLHCEAGHRCCSDRARPRHTSWQWHMPTSTGVSTREGRNSRDSYTTHSILARHGHEQLQPHARDQVALRPWPAHNTHGRDILIGRPPDLILITFEHRCTAAAMCGAIDFVEFCTFSHDLNKRGPILPRVNVHDLLNELQLHGLPGRFLNDASRRNPFEAVHCETQSGAR